MSDIDKITVNNTTYNIKDSTARDSISRIVLSGCSKALIAPSTASDNVVLGYETTDGREIRLAFMAEGSIRMMKKNDSSWDTLWTINAS